MPPVTFFICLAISVLLWIFVTLSREYSVSYDFKVACTDLPQGKSKANVSSDATLRLTFKAKGFAFLSPQYWKNNRTVNVPVEQLIAHKGDNLNSYQFTQAEITEFVREHGDFGEAFVGVEEPSTLTIYLSK